MILSASRRTDIPNYYSRWFLNRLREGFLCVRNPWNTRQVSRISLSPEVVDCIVFWTKNPADMIKYLEYLEDYTYYFQFTLTGYGRELEPGLPDKRGELLSTFRTLSEKIGRERVIWRYDPILFDERYTMAYHLKAFERIAGHLADYTERVVISFLDLYAKTRRNLNGFDSAAMTAENMTALAGEMAQIAAGRHLTIESCAEQIDLHSVGIEHGSCIDQKLIERLAGCKLKGRKDKNQRESCRCLESVDVGAYHTCLNGCKYCYANDSDERVRKTISVYDENSPLLCGTIRADDRVLNREVKSLRDRQISLLDFFDKTL
ncbi:DUF1848 domain-containing protein [Lachnospiraceae bacterium JLR.KK008]